MSWDRNNLAPHPLLSFLCDSLSPSLAGLNLSRHLGQSGMLPMVASNGPNTSYTLGRGEEICFCPISSHYHVVFGLCPPLPPPPLPGVGGGTSPVPPSPFWQPTVLGPHRAPLVSLPPIAVLRSPLSPPPLLSPSWSGSPVPQPRLGGLPWRTPTATGAASGGRPPSGLGVASPAPAGVWPLVDSSPESEVTGRRPFSFR